MTPPHQSSRYLLLIPAKLQWVPLSVDVERPLNELEGRLEAVVAEDLDLVAKEGEGEGGQRAAPPVGTVDCDCRESGEDQEPPFQGPQV